MEPRQTRAHETHDVGGAQLEQGSFRDREGRVFYRDGEVYRALTAEALAQWHLLAGKRFFGQLTEAGRLVATEELAVDSVPLPPGTEWTGVLKHERLPFVSYPYEWSFSMLKDAATLQLEVLARALEEDMSLKDATPYNVQWRGTRPVFIDVPSFIALADGDTWSGYRQFCELFLNPLLLQAYKNVSFQPWLRGSLEGLPAQEMASIFSMRDRFRPGVLLHVSLLARMLDKHADTKKDVKRELRELGFKKELIIANVKRLSKLVAGLEWKQSSSEWSEYADHNTYDEDNRSRKAEFVRTAATAKRHRLIWDLGCNTGDYSRIAAEGADFVVSMDADQLAIERLYLALRSESIGEKILPLVMNLADVSPNRGWRGRERRAIDARGTPELTLCLALIHHVVISANVPMGEFLDWLADLGTDLVIEFVTKDDPMVKKLLLNKEDQYRDYDPPSFEAELVRRFEIVRREELEGGSRILYHGKNRG